MPRRSATRHDASLSVCGSEQTDSSASVENAWSSAAVAASVAYPRPHADGLNRQPTSTAGRSSGANVGTDNPA
jgi:hypothetical protein